jgi:pimeloyl-ACP methyl ester carboxylesterase
MKIKGLNFLKNKWTWIGLVVAILLVFGGFYGWASVASGPGQTALSVLQSDKSVNVQIEKNWIAYSPTGAPAETGFIFYPGGKVDYRSYAPLLRQVAAEGYLVVVVKMPLNLAVFNVEGARDVIAAYPDIQNWVIGGHSLGGSMAASFANDHPDLIKGLVLWASYPASNDNLADSNLKVASISGSQDGLATPEKIDASRKLLPPDTKWVRIDGGNHAQFGDYGLQSGDNSASIPAVDQWKQTVKSTVDLLESVQR